MYRLEDEDLELGRPHRIAACPLALPGSSLTASTVPPLPAPEFLQSITASLCVLPRCLPSLRTASINFFEDGAAVKGGKAACILLVPKLRSYHVYMPRYDTQASRLLGAWVPERCSARTSTRTVRFGKTTD